MKGWKARIPNYFFVVFGPAYAAKHPINGGVYPHHKGFIGSSGVSAGDVLLLYQNLGVPGIGVVMGTETGGVAEEIYYQFFPVDSPASWGSLDSLRSTVPGLRVPLHYIGNWLQNITKAEFRRALTGTQIDW